MQCQFQRFLYYVPLVTFLAFVAWQTTSNYYAAGSNALIEKPNHAAATTISEESVASLQLLLSRRGHVGSWIGNSWVPPTHWRLRSARELQTVFASYPHTFWWGDSTGRRASATLFAVLNATTITSSPAPGATVYGTTSDELNIAMQTVDDKQVINRAKDEALLQPSCTVWDHHNIEANESGKVSFQVKMCYELISPTSTATPRPYSATAVRHRPHASKEVKNGGIKDRDFVFAWAPCIRNLEATFGTDVTSGQLGTWNHTIISSMDPAGRRALQRSDLLVIAIGIWEPNHCMPQRNWSMSVPHVVRVLDHLATAYDTTIVWRTSGFFQNRTHSDNAGARRLNRIVMDSIDNVIGLHWEQGTMPRLTYVDWAGVIEARSFDEARIAGDSKRHYGLEPRLVLIQMLANHLVDLERVERDILGTGRAAGPKNPIP